MIKTFDCENSVLQFDIGEATYQICYKFIRSPPKAPKGHDLVYSIGEKVTSHFLKVHLSRAVRCWGQPTTDKNSSGDEIANVNFFYDDIVRVQASAYAYW